MGYGLCSEFWFSDEKQIYLSGLKFYTTGDWPYYGPHITDNIQIPGALQGLVVGISLFLLPMPESPFILLNILSFASLCFLSWYLTKRLPDIPAWFVWTWLMVAPWTLNYSTHIVNPSYILPGSILFFVAAMETYPHLKQNLLSLKWCYFMMGIALFWIMQFHMSWVVLVPYAFASFYFQFRLSRKQFFSALMFFALGSLMSGVFILPTFLKYGFIEGLGGTNNTVQLNSSNMFRHLNVAEGILGRFLSFATFELPRFTGRNLPTRLAFFRDELWLIPFGAFLFVVAYLHPLVMFIMWFFKSPAQRDWRAVKYFTLLTLLLLYTIFLFTWREPVSHTYYITLPVAMLYSMYCWSKLLQNPRWLLFAKVLIISSVIFQAGFALHNYSRISLYVDRNAPRDAIELKNYRILGERRSGRY
ncbi:MAG: hypothetical protein WKF74_06000 [Pyrinomonadaceae bacterium]